jgi:hypothetical protein
MNPFEMVVLIILIITIGRVASGRVGGRRGRRQGLMTEPDGVSAAEAARLRDEVTRLNERIQVLERLATDPAKRLSDEIDALKNK